MQPQLELGNPFYINRISVTLGQVAASCVAKLKAVSFRANSNIIWFTRGALIQENQEYLLGELLSPKARLIK